MVGRQRKYNMHLWFHHHTLFTRSVQCAAQVYGSQTTIPPNNYQLITYVKFTHFLDVRSLPHYSKVLQITTYKWLFAEVIPKINILFYR